MDAKDFIDILGGKKWIPRVLNPDIVLKRPRLIAEWSKEQNNALQGEIEKLKPMITACSTFMTFLDQAAIDSNFIKTFATTFAFYLALCQTP